MQTSTADSAAVLAAAERFRQAITAGDQAAAEAVLLPEAVILESGGRETRSEYLSHHFVSDGAFLKAVTREPVTRSVQIAGDAAWISSVNRMHGNYRDRMVDVNSAELLVLRRTPAGWRVAAVHWSSRPRT
jgi:ketosteroid isomerase-like protein